MGFEDGRIVWIRFVYIKSLKIVKLKKKMEKLRLK